IAVLLIPPNYRATSVVIVDPRQPRVATTEAVLSGIGSDAAAVESQVEIIESSAIAKRVIAKLGLEDDSEFNSGNWFSRNTPAESDARLNQIVYAFQNNLSVKRRGLTYILEISFTS